MKVVHLYDHDMGIKDEVVSKLSMKPTRGLDAVITSDLIISEYLATNEQHSKLQVQKFKKHYSIPDAILETTYEKGQYKVIFSQTLIFMNCWVLLHCCVCCLCLGSVKYLLSHLVALQPAPRFAFNRCILQHMSMHTSASYTILYMDGLSWLCLSSTPVFTLVCTATTPKIASNRSILQHMSCWLLLHIVTCITQL